MAMAAGSEAYHRGRLSECEFVFAEGSAARKGREAGCEQHCDRALVGCEDAGPERRVPLVAGTSGELREQCRAEPVSLPVVGHGRRDLGHPGLAWQLDVAGGPDPAPCGGIDGDDGLVVMVVDVDEEVELSLCQSRLGAREAEVARLVGQSSDGGGESFAIASLE